MAHRNSYNRKRRRSRGRLGPLFKLLCLAALVVALTAGATVFFRVETVAVVGNQRYTQEEIVAASGIQMGDNLYALNKTRIDGNIRTALPYIGALTIRRSLPSTIVITVTEWDAVAQVLPPTAQQLSALQEELDGQEGAEGEEETAVQSPTLDAAEEPWLINMAGKLLEPAGADSAAIRVSGLTALSPQAGTQLQVPQPEQTGLEALLALLAAMDEAGMTGEFSAVTLGDTQMELRYLDRFDVKMELNADFRYGLQVLQKAREEIERRHGPEASGAMDMTQDNAQLI